MTFNELKQLVDSGNAQAMLEMGELYYQGEQIERDTAMAVVLWERATENSDNEIKLKAIQRLVQFYVEKKDEFAAIKWAIKEEQFGSSFGMESIAISLCMRWDVRGLEMLMELAKKGNTSAMENLAHYANKFISKEDIGYYGLTSELQAFIKQYQQSEPIQTTDQPKTIFDKIKTGFSVLCLLSFLLLMCYMAWCFITPTVIVIEDDERHRTENVLSSLTVKNAQGKEIQLKNLKFLTRYVYNASSSPLICYNTLYSNDLSDASDFSQHHFVINQNVLQTVKEMPDFFFEEPDSIMVEEHFLISIFNKVIGEDKEIRWIVDYCYDDYLVNIDNTNLKKLADHGNASASWELANRYFTGNDAVADRRAFQYIKKAAEQGHAEAILSLGMMYMEGIGTSCNPQEAFEWYKLASDKGDASAHYFMAQFYAKGNVVEQDVDKYVEYLRVSAEGGFDDGQAEYALILLDRGNVTDAVALLNKSLKQHPRASLITLAGIALINVGTEECVCTGYECLQYAAKQQEPDACEILNQYPTLDSLKRYLGK